MSGYYQHYKGGIYEVLDESIIHTETGEEMVLYKKTATGEKFVRPKTMFYQSILDFCKVVPRFRELSSQEIADAISK